MQSNEPIRRWDTRSGVYSGVDSEIADFAIGKDYLARVHLINKICHRAIVRGESHAREYIRYLNTTSSGFGLYFLTLALKLPVDRCR